MIDLPIGTGFFYRRLTIRRLVWAFLLFHIIRAISTVQADYEGVRLNDLTAQAHAIEVDNQTLSVQLATLGSVNNLQNYAMSHNLVPVKAVFWVPNR